MKTLQADIVVIGSGMAGLTYALQASAHGTVAIITKKRRADSNTNYAQGGVAAVFDREDSIELHVRDTLLAGCGLCHRRAVRELVREGPARVRELVAWGVEFTRVDGGFSLGREGGHSRRRILHAGDLTGREIERALLGAISERPAIALFEDHIAIDLVVGTGERTGRRRCTGVLALDHVRDRTVLIESAIVVVAAGGLGQVYPHTTNPDIATGDGVAMAWRAGAAVANLEFVQFHPTALHPAGQHAFLISEAVRGEGAVIRRLDGQPLMQGVHREGSLAPRDVVARTIDIELKRSGSPYVLLDLSPIDRNTIERRFAGILAECMRRGLDPRRDALPVVPAAHYACGGIVTDSDGRTSLPGLFAAGEAACTGVHGANRLASNSLLEAVVYSHRAALVTPHELTRADAESVDSRLSTPDRTGAGRAGADARAPSHAVLREELRRTMWDDVGIVRDSARLQAAEAAIARIRDVARDDVKRTLDPASIELRNLADTASLIIACARRRHESRGLHQNRDYPYHDNENYLEDTVLGGVGGWRNDEPT